MPFVTMPGLKGKVYVPEERPAHTKKYQCKNCYFCQMCPDTRCSVCFEQEQCKITNDKIDDKN